MPVDYRASRGWKPKYVAIAGLYAGIEHVRQNAHLKCHERQLFELINVLSKYRKSRLMLQVVLRDVCPSSCTVAGYTPVEFATVLDQHFGIAVRAGLHCAPRAHQFLGTAH